MDDDRMYPGVVPRPETRISEHEAGPDRLIVVYEPPDTGNELDARAIFAAVAADASVRADDGFRIRSMTSMPLRHAGSFIGNDGSGYQTKVAVAVVYEQVPPASG